MGIAQTQVPPGNSDTELEVSYQRFFVYVAAVAKGVAVKKDVAGDGPALNAGKQIPAETVPRNKKA
nr:hypothetical protein [Desulfococcus multivorans]